MTTYAFDIFLDDDQQISFDILGDRHKLDAINYLLTKGLILNENTVLETIYPLHRIKKILITNKDKLK